MVSPQKRERDRRIAALKAKVKALLCMPADSKFIRCASRDMIKVRKFEASGDFSHSAPYHSCEACRCSRLAGQGTKGDFYGLGWLSEDIGHIGVGFCERHERGRKAGWALHFARTQMNVLQQFGMAQDKRSDYDRIVKYRAKDAQRSQEIRRGIQLIQDTLSEFQQKCVAPSKDPKPLVKELRKLRKQLKEVSVADPKLLAQILLTIDTLVLNETTMTESVDGNIVSMTGKSRVNLACKIASTLAALGKDRFKVESSDYIHRDELTIRIPRMLALRDRYIHDVDDRRNFTADFKDIWRRDDNAWDGENEDMVEKIPSTTPKGPIEIECCDISEHNSETLTTQTEDPAHETPPEEIFS